METQKQIIVSLPQHSVLNEEAVQELEELFAFASPQKLRRHLQAIFFSFLLHEHEFLPNNFEEMTADLQFLLEFLDRR